MNRFDSTTGNYRNAPENHPPRKTNKRLNTLLQQKDRIGQILYMIKDLEGLQIETHEDFEGIACIYIPRDRPTVMFSDVSKVATSIHLYQNQGFIGPSGVGGNEHISGGEIVIIANQNVDVETILAFLDEEDVQDVHIFSDHPLQSFLDKNNPQ